LSCEGKHRGDAFGFFGVDVLKPEQVFEHADNLRYVEAVEGTQVVVIFEEIG